MSDVSETIDFLLKARATHTAGKAMLGRFSTRQSSDLENTALWRKKLGELLTVVQEDVANLTRVLQDEPNNLQATQLKAEIVALEQDVTSALTPGVTVQ